MNVIEGQANLKKKFSLTFYSLTFNNILNIVVMLILVGVTVNVALNGGLFQSADKATKQTQREADREILQAAVIAALNEQLKIANAQAIKNNLPDGWEVTGAEGGPYTCTSPKENVFIVYENGEITEPWVDNGNGTFTKGDTTVEIGKTYTNAEFEELLKKLGIIEEYTGDYKGDWQVLGLEGGILKLVSTGNVSDNVILGYNDSNLYKETPEGTITSELKDELKDKIVDSNGDGKLEFEKAVWSYAHAVDTLDEVAQKATKIESARSITIDDIYGIIGGEENVDKSSNPNYGKTYKYYCDGTTNGQVYYKIQNQDGSWPTTGSELDYQPFTYTNSKKETVTIGTLADKNIKTGEVELTDNEFNYTLDPEIQHPAIESLKEGYYWLASPCVDCGSIYAFFWVRCMDSGNISNIILFYSSGGAYSNGCGVRAVVSI